MKKLVLLFSFVLLGLNLSSQIDSVGIYINRGIAYDNLGKSQLAIDDYSSAIRINPNNSDAYYNRGNVFGKLDKYQLAIDDFSSAIRINPVDAGAYSKRGITYKKLGKSKQALDDYSSAIRINPDDEDAYFNRGNAKWYLKLDYCSDFKRACDLGKCVNYNKFCK